MTAEQKSLLSLHIAILFFGFTAVLGDLISLEAVELVWWRLILSVIAFIPILILYRSFDWTSFWRHKWIIIQVSLFLSFHWIGFFSSVKLANASVAVLCIATTSFITAILEPLITKRSFRWREIIFGFLIVPGMFLVVSAIDPEMYWGIVAGLIAAVLGALFTIYNKSIVGKGSTMFFTFMELMLAIPVVTLVILFMKSSGFPLHLWPVPLGDWKYLLFLALVCTTFSYTIAFDVLKNMTAFMANLSISLEPVYGIILAALILNEYEGMNLSFYLGATLILVVVIIFPILDIQLNKKKIKKDNARII